MQFHPEGMAGPRDLEFLFDIFLDTVKEHKNNKSRSGSYIYFLAYIHLQGIYIFHWIMCLL